MNRLPTCVSVLVKTMLVILLVALPVFTAGAAGPSLPPPTQDAGQPQAAPPGMPVVGMLRQHTYSGGFATFVQVDRVWDDDGDVFRAYFNANTVQNDQDEGMITVWFLEEYPPNGRKKFNLGDVTYKYYPITLYYLDDFYRPIESEFDYSFFIGPGGEACDADQKVLAVFNQGQIQKLTMDHMPYIRLGDELKRRYNLK